ncbi:Rad51b [Ramazzottius varieornatus]|uniref:Rad51b n=1 Tax=Ramazzottius varieornatus TaxID=947166 RepID=A0A1D1W3H5_RAMVA|nr:Rad51b [Ramazzottius varieornatus]
MDLLKPFAETSGLSGEQLAILTAHYPTALDFLDIDCEVVVSTIPEAAIPLEVIKRLRRLILHQLIPKDTTGNDLFATYQSGFPLTFGLPHLDDIFRTELRNSEVLEVCGTPLSGKTQLCLQLICHNLLDTSCTIAIIDTGSHISPSRIAGILRLWGHGEDKLEECLRRLTFMKVTTISRLLQALDYVSSFLPSSRDTRGSDGVSTKSIVVIDSLYAIVAPIIGGRKVEGFALMSQLAFTMKYVATELQAAVVYTNLKPPSEDSEAGLQANLGVFWQSVPHHRISVHRVGELHVDSLTAQVGHATEIVVSLVKSTKIAPICSVTVCITPAGLSWKTGNSSFDQTKTTSSPKSKLFRAAESRP